MPKAKNQGMRIAWICSVTSGDGSCRFLILFAGFQAFLRKMCGNNMGLMDLRDSIFYGF
jgi:hypothetical protein